MQIQVWKCAETGEIFEVESDYLAHVARLQAERSREDKQHRVAQLRKHVFDSARSMGSLMHHIISNYEEMVSLLVDIGELGTESLQRRLVEVRQLEHLNFVDKTPGSREEAVISGSVMFVYAGECLEDDIEDVFTVFPALLGKQRCPGEASSSELSGSQKLQVQRIEVAIASMRKVAAGYADFVTLHPKRQALRRNADARLDERLATHREASTLRETIAELTRQLEEQKQKLEAIKSRHWPQVLRESDDLRRYLKARTLLLLPNDSR